MHSKCSKLLTLPSIQQQSLLIYELGYVFLEAGTIRIWTQHLCNAEPLGLS
jgi:hypothetical protein